MNLIIHLTTLSLIFSDPARDVLLHKSDKWFICLVVSTCAVFLGVILEAPEGTVELIDWFRARRQLKWVRNRSEIFSGIDPAHWTKSVSFLGLALVVFGVIGEGIFEVLSSRADAAVRTYDETAIELANQKAANAATSADEAVRDAKQAQNDLKQVEDRVAGLNKDLDVLTPRWKLLSNSKDAFTKELSRFKKQQFKIQMCLSQQAPIDSQTDEITHTWWWLMAALSAETQWKPESPGSEFWEDCSWVAPVVGEQILVNRDAPPETKEAARAISNALGRILPWQPKPILADPIASNPGMTIGETFMPGSPWLAVRKDPSLIAIIVGEPPGPKLNGLPGLPKISKRIHSTSKK